jgi:hypothetical protein
MAQPSYNLNNEKQKVADNSIVTWFPLSNLLNMVQWLWDNWSGGGGGGSPGGDNYSVQYNNNGSFGGVIGNPGYPLISGGLAQPSFSNTIGTASTQLVLSDVTGTSVLGDVGDVGNGTTVSVNDLSQEVTIGSNNGAAGLLVQAPLGICILGDVNGAGNGTTVRVNDGAELISLVASYGLVLPTSTTDEITAIPTPVEGQVIWNTTTHRLNVYNGTTWQYITATNGN